MSSISLIRTNKLKPFLLLNEDFYKYMLYYFPLFLIENKNATELIYSKCVIFEIKKRRKRRKEKQNLFVQTISSSY